MNLPTHEMVLAANKRLKGVVLKTPVRVSESVNHWLGAECYFKCENEQHANAFKYRGASNAILQLDEKVSSRGVVTHSSGNHARALAMAASARGISAYIVMPKSAPAIKVQRVKAAGAQVIFCEPSLAARESTAVEVMKKTGATFVHPYNDPMIIAGQGTAALELLNDYPDLDAILTPVGGGGLLSGTCLASEGHQPRLKIYAGEPERVNDAWRSLANGRLEQNPSGQTSVADGLLTNLGSLTYEIIRQHVESIFTVTESEIIEAMRFIHEQTGWIIEASSAVPLAAVRQQADQFADMKLGVILTGGNVDVDRLPW